MDIGFQIISCPLGGEPTAITTPGDQELFVISEIPYVEIDPQYLGEETSQECRCPEGHTFYIYTVPSGMARRSAISPSFSSWISRSRMISRTESWPRTRSSS